MAAQGNGAAESEPIELAAGLRPAQAGVVLTGSARPDHIAATLIDLEIRGHLAIEQKADEEGGGDWVLTRSARKVSGWRLARPGFRDGLLRYEKALLAALPRRKAIPMSQASKTKRWTAALTKAYRQLNREAVRRGFIGPVLTDDAAGHDGGAREDGAASAVATVRAFRSYLARMQPAGTDAWARFRECLPYAVAFGLTPHWAERFAGLQPPASVLPGSRGYYSTTDTAALGAALGAAFADAACTHVRTAVGHGGFAGWGSHHGGGGGHGHGGHGGGGGGAGHHGGLCNSRGRSCKAARCHQLPTARRRPQQNRAAGGREDQRRRPSGRQLPAELARLRSLLCAGDFEAAEGDGPGKVTAAA